MFSELLRLADRKIMARSGLVGAMIAMAIIGAAGTSVLPGVFDLEQTIPVTRTGDIGAVPPAPGFRQVPPFDQALQRPLFSPSRRPAAAVLPSPLLDVGARYILAGTVSSAGGGAATLIDRQTNTTLTLRRGQFVEGWLLTDISSRAVHLRHGSVDSVLTVPH